LTDIAVGTPLVVGTNVKVTDFAEETEALNQNLTNLMKPWRLVDELTITTSYTQYDLSEDLNGKHILLIACHNSGSPLAVGSLELHGELGFTSGYVHLTSTNKASETVQIVAVVSFELVANSNNAYIFTQQSDINRLKIYVKD
jgi:hypothetical protein